MKVIGNERTEGRNLSKPEQEGGGSKEGGASRGRDELGRSAQGYRKARVVISTPEELKALTVGLAPQRSGGGIGIGADKKRATREWGGRGQMLTNGGGGTGTVQRERRKNLKTRRRGGKEIPSSAIVEEPI